ncbi:ciliary microtubule inner protein 2A [Columba livia]|uniref:ciliary microtubule inner protein 2A n=1 Tax=Columba livia TaxID=8932 RepID=UPI0031BA783A
MAGPRENRFFPPNPYYIPGYDGFIPQYNYQFGETFGKTTHRLLTDPTVAKSPRPLLAPLHKPKFIEDFSGTTHGDQGYLPGRPGYFPYEKAGAATSFPEPVLGPKPLPVPVDDDLTMTSMDPMSRHYPGEYVLRARMPHGYPRKISCHPATERREWKLPELIPAVRQEKMHNISQLSGALVGSKPPVQMEGEAETADAQRAYRLPRLDVPRVIQQKVIPGYTGFIPRYLWVYGENYVQAVKEAMDEFDRFQFLQRNPVSSFGKRFPQTYWPNNKIYTDAGLIPFYSGFVPELRNTYALTFNNSTRKAYGKEKRRRAGAL